MATVALSDLFFKLDIPMASGMVWRIFPRAFFHAKSTTIIAISIQHNTKSSSFMVPITCETLL